MEAASNAEPKPNRSYSWRSDCHISPKNCKWLQDNLTDTEKKIKAMIKLIEEDADSFARRAEMYYKKRPELMKLVEEFYRAYRALAERYDRVAGALREANRTIAAVFPNHAELSLPEEASTGLLDGGDEEEAGDMAPFSNKEELKDMSWLFPNEVLKKISENLLTNLNLKEDEVKDCRCEKLQEELSNFLEENNNLKSQIISESMRADKAEIELHNLKETISKLRVEMEATFHQYQAAQERIMNLEAEISQSQDEFQHLNDEMSIKVSKLNISEDRCRSIEQENSYLKLELDKLNQVLARQKEETLDFLKENQNLHHRLNFESNRVDQFESESTILKDAISKLKSEMETALLQYHVSQEENKSLQHELDEHKQRLMRQDEEISTRNEELYRIKQSLEDKLQHNIHAEIKENSLQLEVNMLKQRLLRQEEELSMREKELGKLKKCIEDEWHKHVNSAWAQQSLVSLHCQSEEKVRLLSLEIQNKTEKLKRMELRTSGLEEDLRQLYNENNDLIEKNFSTLSKIVSLQDEIISLRGLKQKLEKELQIHVDESMFIQQELSSVKKERSDFEKRLGELADKLSEVQFSKANLEEELMHLRNENFGSKEETYASLSKILSLQDEILSLRESNYKFEDALQFHVEKKEVLQQELSHLKNEKNDVEKRHHDLIQQIERVNCNVASLQALVMEFHDGFKEPKWKFENFEDEETFHFEKLRPTEGLMEKSAIFNISFSNMNAELTCLQEKIKGLEEYLQSLHGNILKKTVLVSHVEAVNKKILEVSGKNSFLENSLSYLNVEFDVLRGKVKNLEESCLSLCDQKSYLIAENSGLFSQVERVDLHLQGLENRFLLFEGNIANIEENDNAFHQVSTLNNQINLLKEKNQVMMEELEKEQYKTVKSEIDSFIVLQVLVDMNDKNMSLSEECHKYKEKLRRAEELVFGLKHEWSYQEKRLALLSEDFAKHFEGINVKIKANDADRDCKTSNKGDDGVLHIILDKIEELQIYLIGAKEEIHQLQLERSLFSTILELLGLNLTELRAQKEVVQEESFFRKLESSILQSTNQDFFETSKNSSKQKLPDLDGTCRRLQGEIQILEENKSLTEKLCVIREQNKTLEEENEIIFEKAITHEFLSLILRSFNDEKSSEVEWLIGGVEHLYLVTNELGQEMRAINRKIRALEAENMHLKNECRNHIVLLEDKIQKARNALGKLNVQTQTGTKLSEWREMVVQDIRNIQIIKIPEDDILESNKVKLVREKLENFLLTEENALKSTEISRLHRSYEMLEEELHKLHREVETLRREENLTSIHERDTDKSKCCKEGAVLLHDLHASSIMAMVFEEEVIELMQTIKGLESEIVQLKMAPKEEIALRTSHDEDLEKLDALQRENVELKAELNAYLPIVVSLDGDIGSLEEHTLSLANHQILNNKRKQGSLLAPLQRKKSSQLRTRDYTPRASAGILELKGLRAKVKVLQKAVTDTDSPSETTTESAARKSKARKSKGREGMVETRKKKDIIFDLEKSIESGKHVNPIVDYHNKVPAGKFEQTMKDIELDHVLSSTRHQVDFRVETEDLNLQVWGPVIEKNIEYHQIETIEDTRENLSSELVLGKDLSIAKLENPAKNTQLSHQEWVKRVSEALSADAHKLLVLGKNLEELKSNIESSEMNSLSSVTEFNIIRVQLKEAEGDIIKLIDFNCKLSNIAKNFASFDSNKLRRKISDQVQKVSEKTNGSELKLQKIQFMLSKIQEEHKENKTSKAMERRSKLPLKDLIYGKKSEPKQMKRRFCDCMKFKTKWR